VTKKRGERGEERRKKAKKRKQGKKTPPRPPGERTKKTKKEKKRKRGIMRSPAISGFGNPLHLPSLYRSYFSVERREARRGRKGEHRQVLS